MHNYAHSVKPVEAFARRNFSVPDRSGDPVVRFPSTQNKHYQSMLAILREGRELALAKPRVDMPGADILPGGNRQLVSLTRSAYVDPNVSEGKHHYALTWQANGRQGAPARENVTISSDPRTDSLVQGRALKWALFRLLAFRPTPP